MAIFCDILHMWYYWKVKMFVILILQPLILQGGDNIEILPNPTLHRFKSFSHDPKGCYFGCTRSPDGDGIISLIKMTRLYIIFYLTTWSNFWSHQYWETFSIWKGTVFYSKICNYHDQDFKLSKATDWLPISISYLC